MPIEFLYFALVEKLNNEKRFGIFIYFLNNKKKTNELGNYLRIILIL